MKLSTKSRYGVKALADLALQSSSEPVTIKSISERQNISEYYLEQLFAILRKAGFIRSIRGAQGGYVLNKLPESITVKEIISALEGPISVSACLTEESCENINDCPTRLLWKKIKESIDLVTSTTTLKDIIDDYKEFSKKRSE